jgi:hypothetical protein
MKIIIFMRIFHLVLVIVNAFDDGGPELNAGGHFENV